MQWWRKKRNIRVIGSAKHPLLLKRYRCCVVAGKYTDHFEDTEPEKAITPTTATTTATTTFSSGRWEDGRRTSFSSSYHQQQQHHHYQAHHHHHHQGYEKVSYRRQSSSPAVSAAANVTGSSNPKYSSSKEESKTLIEGEYCTYFIDFVWSIRVDIGLYKDQKIEFVVIFYINRLVT